MAAAITTHTRTGSYDVQATTRTVRPGATVDREDGEGRVPDAGHRYRYACRLCTAHGAWRIDGNLASEAGEAHLYARHGLGC